jgi:hypothetical protein
VPERLRRHHGLLVRHALAPVRPACFGNQREPAADPHPGAPPVSGPGDNCTICELCGKPIKRPLSARRLHDGCWALQSRIRLNPALARKVLASLNEPAPKGAPAASEARAAARVAADSETSELDAAKQWFDAYQVVDSYLIERMPDDFRLPHETGEAAEMAANTIAMIEALMRVAGRDTSVHSCRPHCHQEPCAEATVHRDPPGARGARTVRTLEGAGLHGAASVFDPLSCQDPFHWVLGGPQGRATCARCGASHKNIKQPDAPKTDEPEEQ